MYNGRTDREQIEAMPGPERRGLTDVDPFFFFVWFSHDTLSYKNTLYKYNFDRPLHPEPARMCVVAKRYKRGIEKV